MQEQRRGGSGPEHRRQRQVRPALRPALGEPTLFVAARCEKLIKAMESYHYGEKGGELPVKDGEHDHLIDALRYHFVNRTTRALRGGERH